MRFDFCLCLKDLKRLLPLLVACLSPVAIEAGPETPVFINEFLAANNETLADEDGDYSDWIEIANTDDDPVNLVGWSLTDNSTIPRKWVFPDRVIGPGEFLVVFASGKDRRGLGETELHANFAMNRSGEYLALFGAEDPPTPVSEFAPEFPPQTSDVSYGYSEDEGGYVFFQTPTPGAPNSGEIILGSLPDVAFSAPRGFYDNPFEASLSIEPEEATIRYTLDGSTPGPSNGIVYSTPISVTASTVIRAYATLDGYSPSRVSTVTYLLETDPKLRLIPVISLVTDATNIVGPTGIQGMSDQSRMSFILNTRCSAWNGGQNPPTVYYNPSMRGREWERPISVELIEPIDNSGFQTDAGIRVHASDHTRLRFCINSKFSYRLYFREEYGLSNLDYPIIPESPLDEYDKVVLRAGLDDQINPFIRDELARRVWIDMGHPGAVGTFAHVFLNGVFQGYYNPVERPDRQYFNELFGEDAEWDVIKRDENVVDGDDVAWNELLELAPLFYPDGFENFNAISQYLDIENFIDYLLLNTYANTWDWPDNNWLVYRKKAEGERFRFLVWDAEGTFGYDAQGPSYNTFQNKLERFTANRNEIPRLYRALRGSPIFQELFRQRVQFHLFGNGALTDENVRFRFEQLAEIMGPIVPNFDMLPRNDVNDLNDDFSIGNIYIPLRRAFFLDQLQVRGFYLPPTETPTPDPSATATPTPDPSVPTPAPTRCDSGYHVLDALGGRHRVGAPAAITGPLYFGVDFARDMEKATVELEGDGTVLDLVVLDAAGVAHFVGNPQADIPQMFFFGDQLDEFPQGRAMDLEIAKDSQGLWVLTDFGGIYRAGSTLPLEDPERVPGTEQISFLGWDVPMTGDLRNPGVPDPGGATLRAVSFVVIDVNEDSLADGYIVMDSQGGRFFLDPDGEEILPGTFPGFPLNHPYRLLDPTGYVWPFFTGLDIARDLELYSTQEGVVIFDGWGGIHPVPVDVESNAVYFSTNRVSNLDPSPRQDVGMLYITAGFDDPSTPDVDESDREVVGFDVSSIFTDLEFASCAGGLYTLDRFGGVFVLGGARGDEEMVAAPFGGSPYFFPNLLARDLEVFSSAETEFETDFETQF